jgi:hypothetical protein
VYVSQVQGGGGSYPQRPSPPTTRAAVALLARRAGLPAEAQARASARSVASVLQGMTGLQGCRLWDVPSDLQEIALTRDQVKDWDSLKFGTRTVDLRHPFRLSMP